MVGIGIAPHLNSPSLVMDISSGFCCVGLVDAVHILAMPFAAASFLPLTRPSCSISSRDILSCPGVMLDVVMDDDQDKVAFSAIDLSHATCPPWAAGVVMGDGSALEWNIWIQSPKSATNQNRPASMYRAA